MWYFRCSNNSLYYFWEKQSYTIGRKNTDIIISGDESISRLHALLEIDPINVFLTDKGSKYGTFVNENKLKHNEKHKLKEKDYIKFGMLDNTQSSFQLEKLHFTVVTSNVKSGDKKELQSALDFLKANRASAWSKSCTHLVVSEVILTAKVLCALTEEQPIVTGEYFQDYVKSIKNNRPAPNVKDYLPEINESLLSKKIKLEYNSSRKTLFKNKTFVFLTEKCKNQMAELVSVTGGNSISWERQKLNMDTLKKDPLSYIFLEENIDDINQNSAMYKSFSKCVKFLSDSGKRSIPLQEIALAIVHNSCAENCNPLFNRVALLIANTPSTQNTEQVLAYDTEHVPATSTQKYNEMQTSDSEMATIVVMPSYDSIDVSPIEKNCGKRPLDLNSSEEISQPRKKNKEDIQSKFKTMNKVFNDENNKSNTSSQVDSTISNLFSFKRSNTSSQSTSASKTKAFDFPMPSTPKPKPVEEKIEEENPFMRKRKATKDIAPAPKKTPLENISNKVNPNNKPDTLQQQQQQQTTNTTNVSVKSEVSTIIRSNTWYSKTTIKKEIIDEDVKVKIEDEIDNEITKLNEQFRNSIIIEFKPLIVKKEDISSDNNKKQNNSSLVNYKKFKKNNVPHYQTIIITDDQMAHFVVGGDAVTNNVSDDEIETPEMEMNEMPVAVNSPPTKPKRGRFRFAV